ncbi:tyrosine-type recombinase/integrase [Methylobacterium nonmethylotrophicum]|uniref:Integrase DNA-binding domain-containing protein n=1 Tax=Methylobacterium nonmethylotrophicum TaxID=1141884 RepID=A0A4Z0NPS4_9HYPH|nr:integrase family protein [Methylobacterium nonmethylotrophicum]TGD97723.1 hypothetical protein EU555_19030 [Methylobacterium nonmethylotrophicum]
MATGIAEPDVKLAKKGLPAGKAAYDLNDGKTGLVLRVGRRAAKWAWRTEVAGRTIRLTLGDIDLLTLTQARALAGEAMHQVRDVRSKVDDDWVRAELVRMRVVPAPPPPEPRKETLKELLDKLDRDKHWTFAQARERYFDEVRRTKREDTWNDYRAILHAPELARFDDTKVFLITVERLAEVIAETHRSGRERRAEKLADCIRPMWTWMASSAQKLSSGVTPGVMKELKTPERSRKEAGQEDVDEDGEPGSYVPPVAEFGRILAICRAGVMHPVVAAAIELAILTVQRRRTIVNARRRDFVVEGDMLVWKIPPAHRKTALKRGDVRTHDLPLNGAARAVVERVLMRNDDSKWLFPGLRPQKAGDIVTHVNVSVLNHNTRIMPGVEASPHDFRRGYTTHTQELLDFTLFETKYVLDHNEGIDTQDVTESAYSRARRLQKKAAFLDPWIELVEQAAVAAAPLLPPPGAMRAAMTEARKPKMSKPKAKPGIAEGDEHAA